MCVKKKLFLCDFIKILLIIVNYSINNSIYKLNLKNMQRVKKRTWSFMFLFTLLFLCCTSAFAQQRTVTGVISETNGDPIIGASVLVKGTSVGAVTGIDGDFSISVPSDKNTLVITYVGMKTKEVAITGSVVNVTLENEANTLDEVVAIGYGTVKKKDLTGAVSSIGEKSLKDIPISSVAQAMTGRLTGVNVTTTEGSPDADIKIRVRGGGSITQDNSPMYIVDGFQVNNINDIPPTDIQSIDVLKDAASTAIYGSRGANGVIVITTKSGKVGKVSLSLNSYIGVKKTAKNIKVLSPYEYVYYQYELDQSTTFQNYYGRFQDIDIYKADPGTFWQNEVFGETGLEQYYNLSLTGGTEKTKYSLSLTHTDEDYTMINSAFKRTNVNFKLNTQLNDHIEFAFNTRLSYSTIDGPSISSGSGANTKLRNVVKYAPTKGIKAFNEAELAEDDYITPESASLLNNPVMDIQNEYKEQYKFSNVYGGTFKWKIIDNLTFTSNVNYEFINNKTDNVWTSGTGQSKSNGNQPLATLTKTEGNSWGINNALDYKMKINNDHRFDVMLGEELLSRQTDEISVSAKFFPYTFTAQEVLAAMTMGDKQLNSIIQTIGEPKTSSGFFGRANYYLKDRYILSLTARYDGSSVFSPEKRWGFFPGAALAWRVSDEPFMETTKDWLSNLKLRLSYGAVGNDRVGTYWRQDYSFITGKTYYLNEVGQGALAPSSTLFNPNLTWETTITQNLGLDFGFFNERLSGTLEAYWNKTKDLILEVKMPPLSGYSKQYQNVGQTSNRGIELSLTGYIIEKKDFTLSANFNISFNKNIVDKFTTGEYDYALYGSGWNGSASPTYDYLVKVGEPVGQMYGYVTDGYYSFDDFTWNSATQKWDLNADQPDCVGLTSAGNYFGPGHLKLKKIADDGTNKINDNDRTVIGNAMPIHTGGFGLNANYKGFDASVFFNWSYGNDIYNANKLDYTHYGLTRKYQNLSEEMSLAHRFTTIDPASGKNIYYGKDANPDRLREINQNATIWHPIMTTTVLHSWAIEDGSFLRLNNLTLGYSMPKKIIRKLMMENLRFYVTGYNLYCWTNYSGPDPEVDTRRSTPLTPGVDFSAYPKARSFVGGINVTF